MTSAPAIYFSQRVSNADGRMIGIAIVGVTTGYFRHIYEGIASLQKESFLFLRKDGVVLVRHPDAHSRAGEKMPANSPWYALVRAGGGNYRSPGYFDGVARLVAVRPLVSMSRSTKPSRSNNGAGAHC